MYDRIRGQETAVERLKTGLRHGRVAHAYLFAGPSGVGKYTTARAFAGALLCEAGHGTGAACGVCRQCKLFGGSGHPDYQELVPHGSTIGIDQVRRVVSTVGRKPYRLRHVVVIDEADRCTAEAQNAFLKTLEDPPENAVFILISAQPEALLPTVLSRCSVVKFLRLQREIIVSELTNRHGVPVSEAKVLAVLAEGSMGRALELRSPEIALIRERALELASEPTLAKVQGILAYSKAEASKLLEFLSLWYRDLLLYRYTRDPEMVVNTDRLLKIERAEFPPASLLAAAEAVEAGKKMLRANVNPRLVIEGLVIRLASILGRA